MQKILEVKSNDWIKGQSSQVNLPIDGLFQSISNWDPFEQAGVMLPSLTPATVSLGTTPKFLLGFNSSGTDYIYAHSATKLYQVLKNSPYTVTDVTAQIYQGTAGNPDKIFGRIKWHAGYVYAYGTDTSEFQVHFNAFPVASGSDVAIKTSGVILDTTQDYLPFCVGADGNLYYGNQDRIQPITSSTGTTGNTTTLFIDAGFQIRDIVSDGRYLVVIADNNAIANASKRVGSYECRVYFWDMVTTDANSRIVPITMWDISDSYLVSARILDGNVEIIGYNGVYICNVDSHPKLLRAFPNESTSALLGRPLNPSQVVTSKGSMYWLDGINTIASTGVYNTDVYAFGNPTAGKQKIFYRPYTTGVNQLSTCLLASGSNIIVGNDTPSLYIFNTGSTRGTAITKTVNNDMPSNYTYGYTKVALAQPLTTGQSVTVTALMQSDNQTLSTETKSYSASNPKQTLLFRKTASGGAPDKFSDITVQVTAVGAQVVRFTTYADALPDTNEDI